MEIRDALTLELLSALQPTEPTSRLMGTIAYSPDGRSLCISDAATIIWDIQTGGVAGEIQCDETYNVSPVWSLDGRTIGIMSGAQGDNAWTVRRYDVVSGIALPSTTFQSHYKPHLWAHEESFWVMTTARDGGAHTINISEVGPIPTKIESFPFQLEEGDCWIESFSPTTHRISVSICLGSGRLLILDVWNSGSLLNDGRIFSSHCFSSDGGLFAASRWERVHIWEYNDGCYTPWRQLPFPTLNSYGSLLQFSSTSSAILGHSSDTLRLWRLDGSPVASAAWEQLGFFSRSCTYIATARHRECIVTITNLSRAFSQSIDTDMEVERLAITDDVLLVLGSGEIRAWRLTGEGMVGGVFAGRIAGRDDSIWTISGLRRSSVRPRLLVVGGTGIIRPYGGALLGYDTGTGELFRTPLDYDVFSMYMSNAGDYFHDDSVYDNPFKPCWMRTTTILEEGWVRGFGHKHQLWLPAEWRAGAMGGMWYPDAAIMKFSSPRNEPIVIKLY